MKLTAKGRYAVMAMVDLATHTSMGSRSIPLTLEKISQRQDISLPYLAQLFGRLRRAGLVKSVRGPGGGYLLTGPASDVPIAAIMLAVDEHLHVTRCGGTNAGGCMSQKTRCLTHDLWEELGNQIYFFLSAISLDDVCNDRVIGMADVAADRQVLVGSKG